MANPFSLLLILSPSLLHCLCKDPTGGAEHSEYNTQMWEQVEKSRSNRGNGRSERGPQAALGPLSRHKPGGKSEAGHIKVPQQDHRRGWHRSLPKDVGSSSTWPCKFIAKCLVGLGWLLVTSTYCSPMERSTGYGNGRTGRLDPVGTSASASYYLHPVKTSAKYGGCPTSLPPQTHATSLLLTPTQNCTEKEILRYVVPSIKKQATEQSSICLYTLLRTQFCTSERYSFYTESTPESLKLLEKKHKRRSL